MEGPWGDPYAVVIAVFIAYHVLKWVKDLFIYNRAFLLVAMILSASSTESVFMYVAGAIALWLGWLTISE